MNLEKRETKTSGAIFDLSGRYRYKLWREFERGSGGITFVMLNPNTADESFNDPTITRCARFAQDWGFRRLEVVNLFALRAKTPRDLIRSKEPVGEENDHFILTSLKKTDKAIFAWGNYGSHLERSKQIVELASFSNLSFYCLAVNSTGEPKHPLYVSKTQEPVRYVARV